MAWVSEDWDRLGAFLSRGLEAYGSERARREAQRVQQAQLDLEQQRADAYIAMLNEQMEASRERRQRDALAAERLRMPTGEAWAGGPETIPLGELAAYQQYQEAGRETAQAARGGEILDDAMIAELFPAGVPPGLTREELMENLPYLIQERSAMRQAQLRAAGAGGGGGLDMNAAMLGAISEAQDRAQMEAVYGFAQQDPDLMLEIQEAYNEMTGEFDWGKIAEYLGPQGWQELQLETQYRADRWLANQGIVTPGMQMRHEERQRLLMGEPEGEAEPAEEGKPRRGMVPTGKGGERAMTTEERREYYLAEHPGLQQPAMRGLLADPQALDVLAKKELYGERGPASGFAALEQMDWAQQNVRPWAGWAGDVRQEIEAKKAAAARRAMLQEQMRSGRRRGMPGRMY